MDRRGFLKTLGVAVGSLFLGPESTPFGTQEEFLRFLKKQDKKESAQADTLKQIILSHLNLLPGDFYKVARHDKKGGVGGSDPEVRTYLQLASLEQMVRDGIILPSDTIIEMNFLNPEQYLWRGKLDKIHDADKAECYDTYSHIKERSKTEPVYQFDVLQKMWKEEFEQVQAAMRGDQNLSDRFLSETMLLRNLDPNVFTAISVQELLSPVYHPWARVMIYRALCDAGFRPHHIPAVHDSSFSYGIVQMTEWGYRDVLEHGGTKDNSATQLYQLPENFSECIDIKQQIRVAIIFALIQLKRTFRQGEKTRNIREWLKEREKLGQGEDVRHFVSVVVAGAHHHPETAKRIISFLSGPEILLPGKTVQELTEQFLSLYSKERNGYTHRIHELMLQLKVYQPAKRPTTTIPQSSSIPT